MIKCQLTATGEFQPVNWSVNCLQNSGKLIDFMWLLWSLFSLWYWWKNDEVTLWKGNAFKTLKEVLLVMFNVMAKPSTSSLQRSAGQMCYFRKHNVEHDWQADFQPGLHQSVYFITW